MSTESVPSPADAPASGQGAARGRTKDGGSGSYGEILKSSAVVGGATLVNVAVGVIRTKAMAVLLGPAGYGLMGTYLVIVELVRTVAQFGVNASGVRQIAEAVGFADLDRTSRTATVLRGTALVSAVLGTLTLAMLAPVVSEVTFGSALHAQDVGFLSAAVFFGVIAGGQVALVQGMRRIGDLSKINVFGAVFGTLASIVLVYFLRERGIVLSLVAVAVFSVITGWWYRRKIELPQASLSFAQATAEAASLLRLGLAFMASGLLMMGTSYVVRIIVLRHSGLEAAGLYHAAWTLGGLYVGFVLQAMGTDFYPRLVAAIGDHDRANQLVNEQAKVSLLLAGPGVIATLALAPAVIAIFYSTKFYAGVDILRWTCLGMAMRVITWPIGYVVVAKNRQLLFSGTEFAWAVVNLSLTWICVVHFGVVGAGIAFFGSYLFHGALIYPLVRYLTGFGWSRDNLRIGGMFVLSTGAVFASFQVFSLYVATTIGMLATVVSGAVSARALVRLVSPARIPRLLLRLLQIGGLAR